jgi:cytochrome P450
MSGQSASAAEAVTSPKGPPVFNPFDPAWRKDPYPLYRRLRNEAPVGQVPKVGTWYVTRFADCQALLRSSESAGSDTRKSAKVQELMRSGLREAGDLREQRSFVFLDPPDHTRLRGLVATAFTPQMVERVKPRIRHVVQRLLDEAEQRRHLEVVGEFAYPLTLTMICDMLGIPPRDEERFREWSEQLAASIDPQLNPPSEVVEGQKRAMNEATEYLLKLLMERRKKPGDDLISALYAAEREGQKLSEEELLSSVILVFAAGHETSVHLIGNSTLALLTHPEQRAVLRADSTLYCNAVEETLRWDPMIQMTQRVALQDLEIGGCAIPKGSPIMVLIAAANRDEAENIDGERFDITRTRFPHLAFGFGPHFCLGAPLARVECEESLKLLFTRFPNLHVGEKGYSRRQTLVLRGLAELHTEL